MATQKTSEQITTEFFKKRFPQKNIELEKEYGYFQEWKERFESENPEAFMDSESLKVWKEMQKEEQHDTKTN